MFESFQRQCLRRRRRTAEEIMALRILHVLDHSIPLHSGYTFRTRAILREQAKLGWQTFHLTSPKQGRTDALCEEVDGLTFYRCPRRRAGFSAARAGSDGAGFRLEPRVLEVAEEVRPTSCMHTRLR
jgi:glycogen(starch) synthase